MKRTAVAAWILAESVSAQMTIYFATQARAGLFWVWKQYWSLLVDTLPKSGVVLGKQEGRSPWPLPGLRPAQGWPAGSPSTPTNPRDKRSPAGGGEERPPHCPLSTLGSWFSS